MSDVQTTTIQTEVPMGIFTAAQNLVEAGWFRSLDELILDALRRFLESHQVELMEDFTRQGSRRRLGTDRRSPKGTPSGSAMSKSAWGIVCDAGPLIHLDELDSLLLLADL